MACSLDCELLFVREVSADPAMKPIQLFALCIMMHYVFYPMNLLLRGAS